MRFWVLPSGDQVALSVDSTVGLLVDSVLSACQLLLAFLLTLFGVFVRPVGDVDEKSRRSGDMLTGRGGRTGDVAFIWVEEDGDVNTGSI